MLDQYYYGKEEYEKYGEMVSRELSGQFITKRKDLANEDGGLLCEASKLGLSWVDLLCCLEGMCYNGTAEEVNDSTYYVLKHAVAV